MSTTLPTHGYGFDRFQIVLGHYVFCLEWHGGQTCPLYERLCRIDRYFTPGYRGLSLDTPGNELAAEVYRRLCEEHGFTEGGVS